MAEQRETGTRCFFPVVSMHLLMAVVLAIASPYALKTGTYVGGTSFGNLLIACYIMASYNYLGQAFVNQVCCFQ